MRSFLNTAALLLAGTITATAVQAGPITARLTARDVYWAYTGAANGGGLALLGGDNNYATAENYSANVGANQYLYVVAWTSTGQEDQAFQGSVTTSAGTTYTGTSGWQAVSLAAPFSGFSDTSAALAASVLETEINSAVWQSNIVALPANTWGDRHGGGQAQWIWHNTFTPANGPLGYTIFRTALDAGPGNDVPEPTSLALVALALGLARWRGVAMRGQSADVRV
jgi:hypothetical protein